MEVSSPGYYGLEVTFLENGCTTVVDDSVEVRASDQLFIDLSTLRLPNVMTPGDPYVANNKFRPVLPTMPEFNPLTIMDEYDLSVHNRWGNDVPQRRHAHSMGRQVGRRNPEQRHLHCPSALLGHVQSEQTGELRGPLEIIRTN